MIGLLSTLSGISVLHPSPDLVQLQLTTLCPTGEQTYLRLLAAAG